MNSMEIIFWDEVFTDIFELEIAAAIITGGSNVLQWSCMCHYVKALDH